MRTRKISKKNRRTDQWISNSRTKPTSSKKEKPRENTGLKFEATTKPSLRKVSKHRSQNKTPNNPSTINHHTITQTTSRNTKPNQNQTIRSHSINSFHP